ncbi:hypothetical protein GA0115254_119120 [Streptomyces sp. Ncost-T10-10d]|nr:hypothetical protein GA0115254_119120 [Streptomyces sp. Ncost-T10-10d]
MLGRFAVEVGGAALPGRWRPDPASASVGWAWCSGERPGRPGQLGDGAMDFRAFRTLVEVTGFFGPIEVEIFNEALWARDGAEVLAEVASRYAEHAC